MAYCLDASVVLNWLLPQRSTQAVHEFIVDCLRKRERLLAPPLLFSESTSVLRRYVYNGALLNDEAAAALRDLLALPLSTVHQPQVYLSALRLAQILGHAKAYDVQYVAVADNQQATLATCDRGMYQSALSLGISAQLLA